MHAEKSFEERFHELRPGLHWRLWRDIRCLGFLAGMVWRNLTLGRRVRARYLDCKVAGKPFWLDQEQS